MAKDVKKKIVKVVCELMETEEVENLTLRYIADKAEVSLGLINYHFTSKDDLFLEVMSNKFYAAIAELEKKLSKEEISEVDKLKKVLFSLADLLCKYSSISKAMVGYVLTRGDMETASLCIPYLRKIFGDRKDEIQIRIISFRIMTIFQSSFIRHEQLELFTGIDFMDKVQREQFIIDTINREAGY